MRCPSERDLTILLCLATALAYLAVEFLPDRLRPLAWIERFVDWLDSLSAPRAS